MIKTRLLFTFIIVLLFKNSYLTQVNISFIPMYSNVKLLENHYYKLNNSDSISFSSFKFYISSVQFLNHDTIVWREDLSYHLIDVFNDKTLNILLKIPAQVKYNQLNFNLGIDSVVNTSGALGGDLDPTRGMYWTWQSGYINLKLEGTSNVCKTRHNEFQFHLGGYQYPFNSIQNVDIDIQDNAKSINLDIDVANLIKRINLSEQHHIMQPSKEAFELLQLVKKEISNIK